MSSCQEAWGNTPKLIAWSLFLRRGFPNSKPQPVCKTVCLCNSEVAQTSTYLWGFWSCSLPEKRKREVLCQDPRTADPDLGHQLSSGLIGYSALGQLSGEDASQSDQATITKHHTLRSLSNRNFFLSRISGAWKAKTKVIHRAVAPLKAPEGSSGLWRFLGLWQHNSNLPLTVSL